uniref:Uncharacterized protein n=1 Tax=Romanomermis culicivorax TaxID=13658 RepID=A0A915KIU9_ROMCU
MQSSWVVGDDPSSLAVGQVSWCFKTTKLQLLQGSYLRLKLVPKTLIVRNSQMPTLLMFIGMTTNNGKR